jgi:hypothetical protein
MASRRYRTVSKTTLGKVEALLGCADPDVDFDQFIDVMDAVYVETQGTKAGLAILETWTRKCVTCPLNHTS